MIKNIFNKSEKLKEETKRLIKENQKLKKIAWNNDLKIAKAKIIANDTIKKLNEIQEIDRRGIREESKRNQRNAAISNLKKEQLNIIEELTKKI